MNRFSSLMLLMALLVIVPCSFAQNDPSEPAPIPDARDLASSDLIAWSGMQAPQPVPPSGQQPLGPDPQAETQPQHNPTPAPDTAPTTQPAAAQPQGSEQNQSPATRTFLGTIQKHGDSYVLKSDSTSYQLDAQDRAKQFEGQKVRVIGILDPSGQSIQVQSIDPV
ncbi:MAG TPA: DUF5818 domain-containing protein [Terriglobales bacterium]|nr:DUF5818 domain-containing protein [Terriglobales bacterium]